jgi:hypothetical protein
MCDGKMSVSVRERGKWLSIEDENEAKNSRSLAVRVRTCRRAPSIITNLLTRGSLWHDVINRSNGTDNGHH